MLRLGSDTTIFNRWSQKIWVNYINRIIFSSFRIRKYLFSESVVLQALVVEHVPVERHSTHFENIFFITSRLVLPSKLKTILFGSTTAIFQNVV
uniref:Uncharacterized protein n=1 Tax=Meloidogyne enterolobii TaxID=390850 RepID=A0A6V7X905_MELEN|nr:unnamed protein product [Meloidogyne enterolobii]